MLYIPRLWRFTPLPPNSWQLYTFWMSPRVINRIGCILVLPMIKGFVLRPLLTALRLPDVNIRVDVDCDGSINGFGNEEEGVSDAQVATMTLSMRSPILQTTWNSESYCGRNSAVVRSSNWLTRSGINLFKSSEIYRATRFALNSAWFLRGREVWRWTRHPRTRTSTAGPGELNQPRSLW